MPPNRRDNLWEPVPGDHGAHGRFDATARPHSRKLWATLNRSTLAIAGGIVAGGIGAVALSRRTRA